MLTKSIYDDVGHFYINMGAKTCTQIRIYPLMYNNWEIIYRWDMKVKYKSLDKEVNTPDVVVDEWEKETFS